MTTRLLVPYQEARSRIRHADLLLFRRRGLIAAVGRGIHSHAAMAAWWDDDLFCLEVREWYGGRAVTLSSQVLRRPGQIDVYHLTSWSAISYQQSADIRHQAARWMRRLCGTPYGYLGILEAALYHAPLVRCLVPPQIDDTATSTHPPFCSQAIAMAYRLGGGVDPVPGLADRITEPADLARSSLFGYAFTIQ
jgi:hypothetical protein